VCCGCAVLQDVLLGLVGVYNTTKTENVKATTASTLSRLLRSNPELLPVLLESCGPQTILKGALCLFGSPWLGSFCIVCGADEPLPAACSCMD
jgi:ABC-type arginine transport system permease subunit